jgi:hypothetical protein
MVYHGGPNSGHGDHFEISRESNMITSVKLGRVGRAVSRVLTLATGIFIAAIVATTAITAATGSISFSPPYSGSTFTINGHSTTGCGLVGLSSGPTFTLSTGAGVFGSTEAVGCSAAASANYALADGLQKLSFTCSTPCVTGNDKVWANWTIALNIQNVISCTGVATGVTIVNYIAGYLGVYSGSTLVGQTNHTELEFNQTNPNCGTFSTSNNGTVPISIVLAVSLTSGSSYTITAFQVGLIQLATTGIDATAYSHEGGSGASGLALSSVQVR